MYDRGANSRDDARGKLAFFGAGLGPQCLADCNLIGAALVARTACRKVCMNGGVLGRGELAVQIVDDLFDARMCFVHDCDFI
jgi:hypothetical protein